MHEFVVEGYYPEWDRNTEWFRVVRVKHGNQLIVSDAHSTREKAWEWLDSARAVDGVPG